MKVKFYGFLSVLTMLSASAMAFEFKSSTPEKSGFDGNQLNEIKAKFDELYFDGRIPNMQLASTRRTALFTLLLTVKSALAAEKPLT